MTPDWGIELAVQHAANGPDHETLMRIVAALWDAIPEAAQSAVVRAVSEINAVARSDGDSTVGRVQSIRKIKLEAREVEREALLVGVGYHIYLIGELPAGVIEQCVVRLSHQDGIVKEIVVLHGP